MTDRKVGPRARALMHHFEECRLKAYLCPAKVWTIGWGNTYYPDGRKVKAGDRITQAEADELFAQVVECDFAAPVAAAIGAAPSTPAQFGAMVALAYNIGVSAFRTSTVARRHRSGDHDGAADAFALWNKAGGRVLAGLVRRRAAEAALYRSDFAELSRLTNGAVSRADS